MNISEEVLDFITGYAAGVANSLSFEELAIRLCLQQANRIELYGNFCRRCGLHSAAVRGLSDIVALPQAVYKSKAWLGSEPRGEYNWFFQTSGTTTGRRGVRPVARMDVYEQASVLGLVMMMEREFPELVPRGREQFLKSIEAGRERLAFFFVKESPQEVPVSSLSWMFEFWRRRLGTTSSAFLLEHGTIREDVLLSHVWSQPEQPIVVAGTALGLVSWAERRGRRFLLPRGSVVIETGGFKGLRREIPKREMYVMLSDFFGLSQDRIVNEYGMTEIFSQSYARGADGFHIAPPWLYVRVVDPYSGKCCIQGQPGVIELIDLASVDCVPAVQTQDLGVMRGGGLELLGRASVEARGCSVEAEL